MFSLICAWTNSWANNVNAGDSRRYRAHYDVTLMKDSCDIRPVDLIKVWHQVYVDELDHLRHPVIPMFTTGTRYYCPACRTTLIATRFRVAVICPLFKCLIVLEFSFILFDLCLLITFFNFIINYVPIVTFWIFTYHKIWILSIMFCFIWSYWIIYFLACLEVSWRVVS